MLWQHFVLAPDAQTIQKQWSHSLLKALWTLPEASRALIGSRKGSSITVSKSFSSGRTS
ncbi:MAG: hypothetical protein R3A45_06880 [Bdellovibrionota bacterium]